MRTRVKLHKRHGFTLVELMVTVSVVAILAAVAVPNLQSFATKSGMNAIKDDFAIAVQRSRLEAINRNTCVSVCQLQSGSTNTCETGASLGNWHQGWVTYINDSCSGSAAATALTAAEIISVRQPGNLRYMLQDMGGTKQDVITFDARGTLVAGGATYRVSDAQDNASPYMNDITVSTFQGRVSVAKYTPVVASQ
jgi:type IV fimbrial biogenesis protein FimT